MSNEAGLTDKERAILATLAEAASADDPALAAALRGAGRRRRAGHLRLPARPALTLHWAFGAALAVVGLVLTVVSLSVGVVLGVVGLLALVAGTGVLVADRARLRAERSAIAERVGSSTED